MLAVLTRWGRAIFQRCPIPDVLYSASAYEPSRCS
jgi:hypothetical protein